MAFQRPGTKSKKPFGVAFRPATHQREVDAAGGPHTGPAPHARRPGPSVPGAPPGIDDNDATHPAKRARFGLSLPVAEHRREILYLLETHATVVLVGETGSGKTTQVPQYLHAAGWTGGGRQVVCTQPRRVAAATVAQRVADELGEPLGATVGYAVRFEEVGSAAATRIRFVTDGVLLREMMDDPLLTRYSVVMVDEAHERSLATDVLLGLLKKVQRRRPELRVIISSATLEVDRLSAFFDTSTVRGAARAAAAPATPGALPSRATAVLAVEGRTYPVQVHYLLQPASDYVRAAVQTACDVHREDVPGDILIFLTGQEECEAAVRLLEEEAQRLSKSRLKYRLLPMPLYAGLHGAQQRAALSPAPRGMRKVVVATNVAETSLTIEGVVYVLDCCFVKQRAYNPVLGLESLLVAPTSKASAAQRAGRAGRVRPGHCFRLCTEEAFQQLLPMASVPEMQRADLTGTLLQLKALGIDNVMRFEWLAPPPAEAVVRGLEALHALGALDDDARLTSAVGAPLASLPLEPQLGAALLAACAKHSCGQEMVVLVAMLSVPSIWASAAGERRALEASKSKFAAAEGDLAAFLNVHKAWVGSGRSRQWAARHHVNQHAMQLSESVASQLAARVRRLGLQLTSSDGGLDPVLRAATDGLFLNAAQFVGTEYNPAVGDDAGMHVYRLLRHVQTDRPLKLRIHASSVLARVRPQTVVFVRCQQGNDGWYEMQGVSSIESEWLLAAAPHVFQKR